MGKVLTNTFYTEAGGKNPVIETPLSAASSTMELLLQSWGGKVRVFPAVPDEWGEASFHHLRAQGGFLVSASRQGKTDWVSVKSLSGEPLIVKVPDWTKAVVVSGKPHLALTKTAAGEFQIDLNIGDEILLSDGSGKVKAVVKPVSHSPGTINLYGVKKGGQLPKDQSWQLPDYNYLDK